MLKLLGIGITQLMQRGLSQLQRCHFNYQMLNYILDDWMPWYKRCYDFSLLEVNRSFETVASVTSIVILSKSNLTELSKVTWLCMIASGTVISRF